MKAFVCELCGSNELTKDGDSFVCAACATRYSAEEARRIMIDGKVDVSGSQVTVDNSARITKLYQVARRAREQGNSEQAANCYEQIAVECPDDWEAAFFSVYFKSTQTKIANIESAASRVNNALAPTIRLIQKLSTDEQMRTAVSTVCTYCITISKMLDEAAYNHYKETDSSIRDNYTKEMLDRVKAANMILLDLGDLLVSGFDDSIILSYAAKCLKKGADSYAEYNPFYATYYITETLTPYVNVLYTLDPQAAKPHLLRYKQWMTRSIERCSTKINPAMRSTAIMLGVFTLILVVAALICGSINSSMMPISIGCYCGAGVTALGTILSLCTMKKPQQQIEKDAEDLPKYQRRLKEVEEKLSHC